MPPELDDPYIYPGTRVLINKADIRDAESLKQHEYERSKIRIGQLEKQHLLLLQLRKERLLADAEILDAKLKGNTIELTEEEIAEIVSKDRKERYEQKNRH